MIRVNVGSAVHLARPDFVEGLAAVAEARVLQVHHFDARTIANLADFRPDLMLVGVDMLDWFFVFDEALARAGCPETRFVLAAHEADDIVRVRAAHAGFVDIVDMAWPVSRLRDAIIRIGEGSYELDTHPVWGRVDRPLSMAHSSVEVRDDTDVALLQMVTIGLSDTEIAEVMEVAPQTIRNRVSYMLHSNGLSNRTQLAWVFVHNTFQEQVFATLAHRGAAH